MKPLKFEDSSEFLGLLLYDCNAISTRYLERVLSRGAASVRSKGGKALPQELWSIILQVCRDNPSFVLVQSEFDPVAKTDDTVILECHEVELDMPLGKLKDNRMVRAYENFMRIPGDFSCYDYGSDSEDDFPCCGACGPKIEEGMGYYRVAIQDGENSTPCLFNELDVPDIIARVEGGKCELCKGNRVLRPNQESTTEEYGFKAGRALKMARACPLCLGPGESTLHDAYSKAHFGKMPAKKRGQIMKGYVTRRLKELGYPPLQPLAARTST